MQIFTERHVASFSLLATVHQVHRRRQSQATIELLAIMYCLAQQRVCAFDVLTSAYDHDQHYHHLLYIQSIEMIVQNYSFTRDQTAVLLRK